MLMYCQVRLDTALIEVLNTLVSRQVSALPVVDDERRVIDVYAKFDVIVSRRSIRIAALMSSSPVHRPTVEDVVFNKFALFTMNVANNRKKSLNPFVFCSSLNTCW